MKVPRVGEEFAGYKIEAVLGRGGMGIVYKAEHLSLERKVALKLLSDALAEDDEFRQRFTREYKLAASMDHPNIIPIYEAGEQDGVLYISMRFVQGADLKDHIRKTGVLDSAFTVSVLEQVASALDAAHVRGLVHRDIKPHNMLISESDGRNAKHVYLSDFGLAKRVTSRTEITATGTFMGTIDYVSPEQIEGKPVDGRADIYALGCVLYECLTGNVPYPGDTDMAVATLHVTQQAPSISEVRKDLPAGLDRVVATALAKSPDDRYQTGGQLVSAVRTVLESSGHELHERVGSGGKTSGSRTTDDRGTAVIDGGTRPPLGDPLGSADPAGSRATLGTMRPPVYDPAAAQPMTPVPEVGPAWQPTPAPARPGQRRRRRLWPWLVAVLILAIAGAGAFFFLAGDDAEQVDQTEVTFVDRASSRFPGELPARFGEFRFQAPDLGRVRAVGNFAAKLGGYYKNDDDQQAFHFVISFLTPKEAEAQRQSHVEFLISTARFEVVQEEPLRKTLGTKVGTVTLLRKGGDAPQEAIVWSNGTLAGGIRSAPDVAVDLFSEIPY